MLIPLLLSNNYTFSREVEMADEEMLLSLCASSVAAVIIKRREKRRKNLKIWTREWLRNRTIFGAYYTLLAELRNLDISSYRNFLRMDVTSFEELLQLVAPIITCQETNMRRESFSSLQYQYRIARQTVGLVVPETCAAIYKVLSEEFLKVPNTEVEWKAIADQYLEKLNFNNCIGAMEGKHVLINPPANLL